MSTFRKVIPFRRCCGVPLIVGDCETPGEVVSGVGEVEGRQFEFIGVMLGDGMDQEKAGRVLDTLLAVLEDNKDRDAWNEAAE